MFRPFIKNECYVPHCLCPLSGYNIEVWYDTKTDSKLSKKKKILCGEVWYFLMSVNDCLGTGCF